ncbi:zinc finger SWIM domain-containing protein 7 isoform X3 [Paramormyrops kingsleyae]|uniref:zinc finger SWIM domain-containing protein 7 isoform X3 n=1 Tax=Paramormyrops kingsleyae TaxID=1676925 RepID=UPI003B976C48
MCTDRTAHSTGAALAGPGVSLTLNTLAEELLRNIKKAYEESSKIPDDLLLALKFLFGSLALQALDLVDQCSVTCLSSPSGRKVFQELPAYSRHMRLGIVMHQEEPRTHCTSVGSDNGSMDFILIPSGSQGVVV